MTENSNSNHLNSLGMVMDYLDYYKQYNYSINSRSNIICFSIAYENMMECRDPHCVNIEFYGTDKDGTIKKPIENSEYILRVSKLRFYQCRCNRRICTLLLNLKIEHASCRKEGCKDCKILKFADDIYGSKLLCSLKQKKVTL
jgi:hypothetical protein